MPIFLYGSGLRRDFANTQKRLFLTTPSIWASSDVSFAEHRTIKRASTS